MKNLLIATTFSIIFSSCAHHGAHHGQHAQHKMHHMEMSAEKVASEVDTNAKIGDLAAPQLWFMSFSAQPTVEQLKMAKDNGVETVINLRAPEELKFDEKKEVEKLGMNYFQVTLLNKEGEIDPLSILKLEKIHKATHGQKQLVHCSSGNRAAAWFAVHMAVRHDISEQDAIKVGKALGVTKEEVEGKIKNFIEKI